ncbi:MAG: HAMP domain-containing histidine kinase [Planctomycetes bacterium]|nr:HAMP domain-containing histidine kinase [Planctomycetota bacterium]
MVREAEEINQARFGAEDPAEAQATVDLAEVAELTRPRQSATHRLVAWALMLVMLPAAVCAVALDAIARQALSDNHARNARLMGQTTAAALAGHVMSGQGRDSARTFDTLSLDPRLGFVLLEDRVTQPLSLRVVSNKAWSLYNLWLTTGTAAGHTFDSPIVLGESGELVAFRVPIWNPPITGDARDRGVATADGRTLEGYLIVGLWEPSLAATVARVRLTVALVMLAVVGVMLPVVILAVRRWTSPLRRLNEATMQLAAGEEPPPVDARSGDEISILAGAFNRMAKRLHTTRRELQRTNADLESKVADRTAELEDAKARLETEIRDKNEFLRTVSHDLNAPLRNISGMANMLLLKYRNVLADDALNKLERINANVKSQTDLIRDLLDLSRLRTTPGRRQAVDLEALIRQIRETLAFDLEKQEIAVEVTTGLPTIVVDKNRARQLFQNLLDNAVKYMLDAKVRRIEVSCVEDEEFYTFCVQDTGRGIAEKDLPNIFQLYKRALHSGTHQVAGRGVGLAGCKTIVEGYGGHIRVESRLGEGAAFFFTLQRDLVDPARAEAVEDEESRAEAARAEGRA